MPEPARVPMLDLTPEIDEQWDELTAAMAAVLRSGRFILGPQVAAWESEAAAYLGTSHAVAVNSGTDALAIALRALGVSPGDEVITTAFTFAATAEAIAVIGAVPMFADIDPSTFCIDPADVARRLSPRTRAVVPVHVYGAPAAVDQIAGVVVGRDVAVVEDAAQAFGAWAGDHHCGTVGAAGAFSFFPSKPLGGFGDGGLLVTDDAGVAATARSLRAHGFDGARVAVAVGWNSRLDELQAAVLRVKLAMVDARADGRRRAARSYNELLGGVAGVVTPAEVAGSAWHLYTIRVLDGRRDEVAAALDRAGVDCHAHYAVPVHRMPAYQRPGVDLPETERAAAEVLSLPLWPTIGDEVIERVAGVVAGALR